MNTPSPTLADPSRHTSLRVVLIAAAAALGGFLFGFDTAVINGAVDSLRAAFGLSAALTGFAVSIALLGSALGAWYAGRLADRFGRVRTMQIAAILLAAGAVGAGLAGSVAWLMAWRVIMRRSSTSTASPSRSPRSGTSRPS